MALQCTYSHCRDDSLISEIVSHVSWIWCRLGWARNCITSSEGGYNGQSITTQRQATVSLNWWLKMTLTWGSLVCLVIVSRRDLYERRQTSKIKTTALQCYVGSSLVVHYCRLWHLYCNWSVRSKCWQCYWTLGTVKFNKTYDKRDWQAL